MNKDLFKDLIPKLNQLTIQQMNSKGVKNNTELSKSVEWSIEGDSFKLNTAFYFTYVDAGRRAGGKKVPISSLVKYIKDKRITSSKGLTTNQLAFAIQNAIYKSGIKPKNYLDSIIKATSDLSEETIGNILSNEISEAIEKELKI